MIRYIKTDVTSVNRGIIAHGVNCQGVMGSGVAKAIKETWPEAYHKYRDLWIETNYFADTKILLGSVQFVEVVKKDLFVDTLYVANCFTQEFYGKDGRKYASIDAVRSCLEKVFRKSKELQLPLYIPKIGCGLGGLNWETDVKPIVEEMDLKYPYMVFVCEL